MKRFFLLLCISIVFACGFSGTMLAAAAPLEHFLIASLKPDLPENVRTCFTRVVNHMTHVHHRGLHGGANDHDNVIKMGGWVLSHYFKATSSDDRFPPMVKGYLLATAFEELKKRGCLLPSEAAFAKDHFMAGRFCSNCFGRYDAQVKKESSSFSKEIAHNVPLFLEFIKEHFADEPLYCNKCIDSTSSALDNLTPAIKKDIATWQSYADESKDATGEGEALHSLLLTGDGVVHPIASDSEGEADIDPREFTSRLNLEEVDLCDPATVGTVYTEDEIASMA